MSKKRSIFKTRDYYKPFDYPIFFEAWAKQQNMFWLPFEICLKADKYEFYHNLTDDERNIFYNVFKIFTHTDFCVSKGYMNLIQTFKLYEIQAALAAFMNMETIHVEAYGQISERLDISVKIFQEYQNIDILLKKHEYMQWPSANSKIELLKTIARISVFTEGFVLFSMFGILLNLPRLSLLKGIGQITTLSMRDETLHHETMVQLYLITKEELLADKEITMAEVIQANQELELELDMLLKQEMETIEFLFNNGHYKMRGTNMEEIKQYVIHLAKKRVCKIGLKMPNDIHYDKSKYPVWLDELVNLRENVDFFAQRPTEYKKADISEVSDQDFE